MVSKKVINLVLILMLFLSISINPAKAQSKITHGKISGRTVVAGALSLIIWPGIGQAVNNDNSHKVVTHAVLGLIPLTRFWSCYDAVVDRHGGYWDGNI